MTLQRRLRLVDAVGIGFGAIIGAGIFVVTGVAARLAGPSFIASLFLAAIAATLNALSSAELAARYPQSGGTYEYGYQLLGPWRGFIAGWMFLASKIAAAGVVAIGLGSYATLLFPAFQPRVLAVATIVMFTALNYIGVQRTSRVNLAIVVMSVSALLLFIIVGATSFRVANFQPFAPAGFGATLQAAAILFFAYTGYARIATLGEEVREPARTIPRAIIITISASAALYVAVATIAVGAVGTTRIGESAAPLAVAARASGGPFFVRAIAAGAVAAMLGVILSQILGMSRMVFAMARRSDLPSSLAAVHPTFGVPHRAIVLIGAAAAVIAATGTLAAVATAASFAILIYYAIANWSALRLPAAERLYPPAIPAMGLAVCIVLALSMRPAVIITGVAILIAGVIARALFARVGASARGASSPPEGPSPPDRQSER